MIYLHLLRNSCGAIWGSPITDPNKYRVIRINKVNCAIP